MPLHHYASPKSLHPTYPKISGFPCPELYNPADFFLDVVSMDFRTQEVEADSKVRVKELAIAFQQHGGGVMDKVGTFGSVVCMSIYFCGVHVYMFQWCSEVHAVYVYVCMQALVLYVEKHTHTHTRCTSPSHIAGV